MRGFYLAYSDILPTVSAKSATQAGEVTASAESRILPTVLAKSPPKAEEPSALIQRLSSLFPLPWSHYERLLTVEDLNARRFYEQEALRGGWSIRQLDRQIGGVAGVELATASEPPARQPRIWGRRPSGVDPSHP